MWKHSSVWKRKQPSGACDVAQAWNNAFSIGCFELGNLRPFALSQWTVPLSNLPIALLGLFWGSLHDFFFFFWMWTPGKHKLHFIWNPAGRRCPFPSAPCNVRSRSGKPLLFPPQLMISFHVFHQPKRGRDNMRWEWRISWFYKINEWNDWGRAGSLEIQEGFGLSCLPRAMNSLLHTFCPLATIDWGPRSAF